MAYLSSTSSKPLTILTENDGVPAQNLIVSPNIILWNS